MKKIWRILLILVVIGILAAAGVYKFVYNKPHQNYLKLKPEHTLSASQLYTAYSSDQTVADATYTGKMVQIEGNLKAIEDLDTLVIAVFSFAEGIFGDEGIRCSFEPELNDDARALLPDQVVKIKGYSTGYNGTDVVLEHCSIVK